MRWVELPLHGSQHVGFYDERVTRALHGGQPTDARVDVTGMPESDLAIPRRADVTWADLLVPPLVRVQLEQAVQHARYRMEVLPQDRGFAGRAEGYRLLLSGLPGTGKTLAAEALSAALGRPMLRLDLSTILSKWLGETEKFLSQVFEAAEAGGCVLVLDEAEALFRQRESREDGGGGDGMKTVVAYLLVRLERYTGVLVATTNRSKDLDEAFFRRFDDYVVIPVPDESTRRELWRRMLGLRERPEQEGRVDLALLARRFAIAGALIRGAAVRARAWASGLGRELDMPLVLAGLARELEKSDKSSNEVYIEPWRAEVLSLLRGEVA
jgi:SpoVK/Ycf46/Vps4 family AAA+-type ATPase